jgi:hypothetical protein
MYCVVFNKVRGVVNRLCHWSKALWVQIFEASRPVLNTEIATYIGCITEMIQSVIRLDGL